MRKKILTVILAGLLTFHGLTGCAAGRTRIAYTVYPIGYLIDRLSGGEAISESLSANRNTIQRAVIRDDYKDVLNTSIVFFHIGDLEPYLDVYADEIQASHVQQYDLSNGNAVYEFARFTAVEDDEGNTSYEESAYYDNAVFDSVDVTDMDLYIWMEPITMLSMARDIQNWLVGSNMVDESQVNAEFESLKDDLINLDAAYQALADQLSENNQEIAFVSMTPGFGIWQSSYGISYDPLVISKYGVLPDEEQLSVIKKKIAEDHIQYIVHEPNMTDDMELLFEEIQNEFQLKRVEMSNLCTLSQGAESADRDYLSIMYDNLSTLETMVVDKN